MRELQAIKNAARTLRTQSSESKNRALIRLASLIRDHEGALLEANQRDLDTVRYVPKYGSAFRDRMRLSAERLGQMRDSLAEVQSLPDPVGEIVETTTLPNGLFSRKIRSPLGVIFLIFESRPNVALEAFSLALKSGNAVILRGGKETQRTCEVFYRLMREALESAGLDAWSVWGITDSDRGLLESLLQQKKYIDVVVPRGGEALIEFVTEKSRIPVIKNDRGLCHVYVHSDADPEMAIQVILNAKTQRPGVCNAMETLLIHTDCATELLPRIHQAISGPASANPVHWHGCEETLRVLGQQSGVMAVNERSYDTEYLDFEMNVRVVRSIEDALAHIEQHGSRHSEAIITTSPVTASRFEDAVDAAAVYWNASTRFTDGYQLGLGGELGISTQKLHVRGPVGLRELTCVRWIIEGTGQVRTS